MTSILLHALVLAVAVGAPAFDRWSEYRYRLSTRWAARRRQ